MMRTYILQWLDDHKRIITRKLSQAVDKKETIFKLIQNLKKKSQKEQIELQNN